MTADYTDARCPVCGFPWLIHSEDVPCIRHRPPESVPPPPELACPTCGGCGQVADTEAAEPWTYWLRTATPAGARDPKPVECPACKGSKRRGEAA